MTAFHPKTDKSLFLHARNVAYPWDAEIAPHSSPPLPAAFLPARVRPRSAGRVDGGKAMRVSGASVYHRLGKCGGSGGGDDARDRLRARDGARSFARAWDRVLTPPGSGPMPPEKTDWRKVTNAQQCVRVETGLFKPVLYRGKIVGTRQKPDFSALLRLLRRSDGVEAGA